ncbi:hypothetical protein B9Z65_2749 [Elsinoe australis]|uniref:Nucleotide-diphospho-sugar transferase n=1 Tax=Elsinoe australis TaxID=40998 RepID=A0A2P8A4G8_9PEZI|nr:hypothetical protein B9Z65_2749 [Elsinoe australis]
MTTQTPRPMILYLSLFLLSALLTWTFHRPPSPSRPPSGTPRLAFATFLGPNTNPSAASTDAQSAALHDTDDGYFLGVRVLTYQLLHSPITASNLSIPFVVLTTPEVSPRKRDRLRADGATVVTVPRFENGWMRVGDARYGDVMTKLRLWELVQFDKVCFLDSDTLVTRRLDEAFWDEGTVLKTVKQGKGEEGEPEPPRHYMFAANVDTWGYEHAWPPNPKGEYFNVGFFCFRPDREVFEYYVKMAALEGKYSAQFPEQNMLNYVHRKEGRMPWARLWEGWNVNWPTERDYRNGVGSFHAKYWDSDPSHDKVLKAIWREQRAEMEGYWRGREGDEGRIGGIYGA